MIISTTNVLAALDDDLDVIAPTAGTGYEEASIIRGPLARAWRAASNNTVFGFQFHTASAPVQMIAVFGVVPEAGSVTSVTVSRDSAWPATIPDATLGTITLDERGDGILILDAPITVEAIVVTVVTSISGLLRVAKVWAGPMLEAHAVRSVKRKRVGNTIRNVSDARSFATARIATPTVEFDLDWPPMLQADEEEIAAEIEEAGIGEKPVVIIPDVDEGSFFFGYLSDDVAVDWDTTRLRTGLKLAFSEEGRTVG